MKLRKILAGFLAGAVAMSSMVVTSITASAAATTAWFYVKGASSSWSLNIPKEDITINEGTETYTVSYTHDGWDGSSVFDYSGNNPLSFYVFDPDQANSIKDVNVVVEVDDVEKLNFDVTPSWTPYLWDPNANANANGFSYIFTEEQVNTIGAVPVNSVVDIMITMTYPVDTRTDLTVPFVTDPVTLTVVDATGWDSTGKAAKGELKLAAPAGITLGTSTFAEIFANYKSITVTGLTLVNSDVDVTAANVEAKLFAKWGTGYTWSAGAGSAVSTGSAKLGESAISVGDTDALMEYGIEFLILGQNCPDVAAMEIGDTFKINASDIPVTSITLDKTTATVNVGETIDLIATVLPADATDPTVTWTSDNTAVATVVNGTVKGIKSGTATITAKAGEQEATCAVTVKNPVKSISLPATAGVVVGETTSLTATSTPADCDLYELVWDSSDTTVATVNGGVVTGVKDGKVTITATVVGTAISASTEVTVTTDVVAATGVTLTPETAELEIGGTTALKAAVAPADATNTAVTYTSSDTNVATVDANGVVTAVAAGTATITVKTVDGEFTDTCEVTVTAPAADEPVEDEDTVIWEGTTDLGTSWGSSITVSDITAAEGDKIVIHYTIGSAATYQQLKLMSNDPAGWAPLTSPTTNDWDCVELAAGTTSYEIALNAADAAAITANGLVVSGYNVTVTKIELISSEAEGFDQTSAEFEAADAGAIVAQTATINGKTAKRFTMLVGMDAIKKAEKATFTLNNGTTTKTYETKKYYTSLTASGSSVTAPEGYGFVTLTITDIPDGVTVTCSKIELTIPA